MSSISISLPGGWVRNILIIICCIPLPGYAQTLNMYDAVNKAVAEYPVIQQRQAEVAAGKAHVSTVNANRLPSLILQDQLNMGTNNALQGPYLSFGMVPSTAGGNSNAPVTGNPDPGNIALSFLQWEFCNFGYYKAERTEAKAQLAVNEANLGSDKYLLTERMIFMYLDWLKKFRLLKIQDQNVQRAQVVLTAIRANVISGLKPGVDSATASASYADARIAYLQALDDYNNDKIALLMYTGLKNTSLIPDTNAVSAGLLQKLSLLQSADSVSRDHPLLDVYQKQYEAQLADVNTMGKKYLPKLSFDGVGWLRNTGISYNGVYPESVTDGMPYNKYNYLFALTLTYNLFDLKHRHDQLVEGRYLADAKQSQLQTQQLSLNQMMQQVNTTYNVTLDKLKEIPLQLYSARQAFGQQMALYRSGLNTLIEVTNAQYELLQAETNYVNVQDELLQLYSIRAGLNGQLDNLLQNFKQ